MSKLQEFKDEREQLGGQLLGSLLKIIFFLLVPVFAAVILGEFLNSRFQTGNLATFFLAAVAIIISWIPIWKIYTKIDHRMVELDRLILELKSKENDE